MAGTDEETGGAGGPAGGGADLHALAVELRRMHGEVNRLAHAFAAGQGLHATDVQALGAILDAPERMTPGRLRERLGLTSGAVTACLDRLERAGHIRRTRDTRDRRVVHLHYTEGGRALARAHFQPLATAAATARARLTQEEADAALRFLAAMNGEFAQIRGPERRPGT
ncbi:MarR family winged helix-turn-helix transcriptional regulator [Streptomyces albidoflavus]|uniref:MarR family winged helix-turn-helix transcriptional regulator n=1 Tax=Streptomyces albidoflavus TaxID=1886 RepID=UPI0033DB592D